MDLGGSGTLNLGGDGILKTGVFVLSRGRIWAAGVHVSVVGCDVMAFG